MLTIFFFWPADTRQKRSTAEPKRNGGNMGSMASKHKICEQSKIYEQIKMSEQSKWSALFNQSTIRFDRVDDNF